MSQRSDLRQPTTPLVVTESAESAASATRQAVIVAVTSAALLVVFWIWGRPGFFLRAGWHERLESTVPDVLEGPVLGYLWWGATSLVLRIGLPLGMIVWVLGRRPADFGYRVRGLGRHWLPYFGMLLVMVPVLAWASSLDSFRTFYPFYSDAASGGATFVAYELGYAVQFLGLEAFFRGYLLFGLRDRLGAGWAVAVMTVPYVLIHAGKPSLEIAGALVAGLALGHLALRSRSFVPGFIVHVVVALTMDLMVLARSGVHPLDLLL